MGRQREWRATPSGWWRSPDAATYSRWRRARKRYYCYERDGVIEPGTLYIETTAAPWHEFIGQVYRDNRLVRVWSHARLCGNHDTWAPPA